MDHLQSNNDNVDLLSEVVNQSSIMDSQIVLEQHDDQHPNNNNNIGQQDGDNNKLELLQSTNTNITNHSTGTNFVNMDKIQLASSDISTDIHELHLHPQQQMISADSGTNIQQKTSSILNIQEQQPFGSNLVAIFTDEHITNTESTLQHKHSSSLASSNSLTTTIEPVILGESQQQQQSLQTNLSLNSDMVIIDQQLQQQQQSTFSQAVIQPQPTQQQQIVIPQQQGTFQPTIVTPNTAHIIAAAAAAQQPTKIVNTNNPQNKGHVVNFPKLALATSTNLSTNQQQQPGQIFLTNQILGSNVSTIPAGNISYILPANASLGRQAFVINQLPSGSGNKSGTASAINTSTANLKLVQTSQGQQFILAPFKPIVSSSTGGGGSGFQQPGVVSIKSAPTAQKSLPTGAATIHLQSTGRGTVSSSNVGQATTATTAQLLPLGTQLAQNPAPQQQQLIILSPIKQPVAMQAKGTAAFVRPSSLKLLTSPSSSRSATVSSTKFQQIAPAPAPSKTQRMIAPSPTPVLANKSSISITTGSTKPIQTLVNTNSKNLQYVSFVPVSASAQLSNHTNQQHLTQPSTKRIAPLLGKSGGIAKQNSLTGASNSTVKPNRFHLATTGFHGTSPQKVLINPNSIKISTTIARSGSLSTSSSTSSSSIAYTAASTKMSTTAQAKTAKPTSIWMLPKQQVIKVENTAKTSVGSLMANVGGTFQIQTTKPMPTACTPASKFVPIAPNPHSSVLMATAVTVGPISSSVGGSSTTSIHHHHHQDQHKQMVTTSKVSLR